MARTKQSFGVDDIFKKHEAQDVQETQQEQIVQEEQDTQPTYAQYAQDVLGVQELKDLDDTQGKKGHKLKRIGMAFSDINYVYIKRESKRNGLSMTEFVNEIISKYREVNTPNKPNL